VLLSVAGVVGLQGEEKVQEALNNPELHLHYSNSRLSDVILVHGSGRVVCLELKDECKISSRCIPVHFFLQQHINCGGSLNQEVHKATTRKEASMSRSLAEEIRRAVHPARD